VRIITLTTDFGPGSSFVGIMKGVILGIAPESRIVDLCHDIEPQDILASALALEAAVGYYPDATIHVAVVDPGVGSERDALAIQTKRGFYVGPDNGIFSLALGLDPIIRAVRINNPAYTLTPLSDTFHGRDIFAPAAAHISNGIDIGLLGEGVRGLVALPSLAPERLGDSLRIHVLTSDRFGNMITNLRKTGVAVVSVNGNRIPISRTYSDVQKGETVAYFGSGGRLEIAIRNGSAMQQIGTNPEIVVDIQGP